MDGFVDVRAEMKTVGHNLTSVLINPRESLYDEMYDDFAMEQNETSSNEVNLLASCASISEDEQALQDLITKLQSIFTVYYEMHRDTTMVSMFNTNKIPIHRNKFNKKATKIKLTRGISDEDVLFCFKEVPDYFFRSDFSLKNPDVFEKTMEISIRGHERLSRYLDLVEVALLRQIWTRSPDFFRALEDIRSLELQVVKAVIHVKGLRSELENADEAIALGAIQIPKLYRRQKNEVCLQEKVNSMQRFLEDISLIQDLVRSSNFMGALQIILSAKKLFQEELSKLLCMQPFFKRVEGFEAFVCDTLCDSFVTKALCEVGDGDLDQASCMDVKSEELEEIKEILHVLGFANYLNRTILKYQARLEDSVQLITRTCVLEYSSPILDSEEEGSFHAADAEDKSLNKLLRSMSSDNFMSFLCMLFEQLVSTISRMMTMRQVIEEVVGGDRTNHINGFTSTEMIVLHEDEEAVKLRSLLSNCIGAVSELAQRRVAHTLSVRSESTVKLSIGEMKLLIETSLDFVTSLERLIGGSMATSTLRQSLLNQTKAYVNHLHDNSKTNLVLVLDNERWEQCDVTLDKQRQIDKLVSGRSLIGSKPSDSESELKKSKRKEISPAVVDGVSFKVVHSAVYLTDQLLVYLEIAAALPTITTDIITKAGELLTLFNTRGRQLILGAQAIQTAARLKSISAKHLCLTAQSLSFVVAILPHIRAALLAQLPPKHHILLTSLDRASATLLEHHGSVLAKFVDIVCDFVDASANKLPSTDWDAGNKETVPYFDEIVKNLTALHRVLESNLPFEQVQDVFSRIFAALQRKMLAHFENVRPNSKAGKQRIVDEVSHLVVSLSRLKKIDTSNFGVEHAFQIKYL